MPAATTAIVQHPSLPDIYEVVPADKAKEWTDTAGWKRVPRDQEDAVRAKHPELNG